MVNSTGRPSSGAVAAEIGTAPGCERTCALIRTSACATSGMPKRIVPTGASSVIVWLMAVRARQLGTGTISPASYCAVPSAVSSQRRPS